MTKRGIRRESNPYSLVHSQACRNRYTTDTMLDFRSRISELNKSSTRSVRLGGEGEGVSHIGVVIVVGCEPIVGKFQ